MVQFKMVSNLNLNQFKMVQFKMVSNLNFNQFKMVSNLNFKSI